MTFGQFQFWVISIMQSMFGIAPASGGGATLTNTRITRRVTTTNAPGATPSTNVDTTDLRILTGLATAITSMTTGLSGTPTDGQLISFAFTDNGVSRAITWGASFEDSEFAPWPTVTSPSTRLDADGVWNAATSKWRCKSAT